MATRARGKETTSPQVGQQPEAQPAYYRRFTPLQRVEHFLLFLSFTVLAITGIPQKYAMQGWAQTMIGLMGGIQMTRQLHHWAAIVLMVVCILHIVTVGYRIFVLRLGLSMLPRPRDLVDAIDEIRYNLGLTKERPKMDRYTWGEKVEYWAVVWGTAIMVITGFMLWNPIATARWLPGEAIPAALAAHGGEALLAVLSIIAWHMYHVHIKRFNRSIFTGKMSEAEMAHEHPLELERIKSGRARKPAQDPGRERRERAYLPVAAIFALVLGFGLYQFVTFEQTAITTLPQRATVVAFVPATLTPTPTPLPTAADATATPLAARGIAPPITHALEGRENCLLCHAISPAAMAPMPPNHAGWQNNLCLACHQVQAAPTPAPDATAAPQTGVAGPITHPLAGREDCLLCHAVDSAIAPAPASHADYANTRCQACHAPPTAETPEPAAADVSFRQDIRPLLDQRCAACHGALGGLSVASYADLMRGGVSGPPVVAGDADASLLVTYMRGPHPATLDDDALALLVQWIDAGAQDN